MYTFICIFLMIMRKNIFDEIHGRRGFWGLYNSSSYVDSRPCFILFLLSTSEIWLNRIGAEGIFFFSPLFVLRRQLFWNMYEYRLKYKDIESVNKKIKKRIWSTFLYIYRVFFLINGNSRISRLPIYTIKSTTLFKKSLQIHNSQYGLGQLPF